MRALLFLALLVASAAALPLDAPRTTRFRSLRGDAVAESSDAPAASESGGEASSASAFDAAPPAATGPASEVSAPVAHEVNLKPGDTIVIKHDAPPPKPTAESVEDAEPEDAEPEDAEPEDAEPEDVEEAPLKTLRDEQAEEEARLEALVAKLPAPEQQIMKAIERAVLRAEAHLHKTTLEASRAEIQFNEELRQLNRTVYRYMTEITGAQDCVLTSKTRIDEIAGEVEEMNRRRRRCATPCTTSRPRLRSAMRPSATSRRRSEAGRRACRRARRSGRSTSTARWTRFWPRSARSTRRSPLRSPRRRRASLRWAATPARGRGSAAGPAAADEPSSSVQDEAEQILDKPSAVVRERIERLAKGGVGADSWDHVYGSLLKLLSRYNVARAMIEGHAVGEIDVGSADPMRDFKDTLEKLDADRTARTKEKQDLSEKIVGCKQTLESSRASLAQASAKMEAATKRRDAAMGNYSAATTHDRKVVKFGEASLYVLRKMLESGRMNPDKLFDGSTELKDLDGIIADMVSGGSGGSAVVLLHHEQSSTHDQSTNVGIEATAQTQLKPGEAVTSGDPVAEVKTVHKQEADSGSTSGGDAGGDATAQAESAGRGAGAVEGAEARGGRRGRGGGSVAPAPSRSGAGRSGAGRVSSPRAAGACTRVRRAWSCPYGRGSGGGVGGKGSQSREVGRDGEGCGRGAGKRRERGRASDALNSHASRASIFGFAGGERRRARPKISAHACTRERRGAAPHQKRNSSSSDPSSSDTSAPLLNTSSSSEISAVVIVFSKDASNSSSSYVFETSCFGPSGSTELSVFAGPAVAPLRSAAAPPPRPPGARRPREPGCRPSPHRRNRSLLRRAELVVATRRCIFAVHCTVAVAARSCAARPLWRRIDRRCQVLDHVWRSGPSGRCARGHGGGGKVRWPDVCLCVCWSPGSPPRAFDGVLGRSWQRRTRGRRRGRLGALRACLWVGAPAAKNAATATATAAGGECTSRPW